MSVCALPCASRRSLRQQLFRKLKKKNEFSFFFRQEIYEGPCDDRVLSMDVPADVYDSIPGKDETIELANPEPIVPSEVYDSVPGRDETIELVNPDPIVPADVYDSIPGHDETIESLNPEPIAVNSNYETVERGEEVEVVEDIEEIEDRYNPNADEHQPVFVDGQSQMRGTRRSFGKIKEKIEKHMKEIELRLSRTGFNPIGDTVGSPLKIPATLAPSTSIQSKLNEFRELIRGKILPAVEPEVGLAAPKTQPITLIEKTKQAKVVPVAVTPTKLVEKVGLATPAVVQPPGEIEEVGAPAVQTDALLGDAGKAGPIVQPTSLIEDNDEKPIPTNVTHTVTKQQLEDTKGIREEIAFAVDHEKYAHSKDEIRKIYQSEHHEHHHHHHHANGSHHKKYSFLSTASKTDHSKPSIVGSERADFSFVPDPNNVEPPPVPLPQPQPQSQMKASLSESDRRDEEMIEEMMAKNLASLNAKKIIANVVESQAGGGTGGEQSYVNSDLREVLHVKSITEDTRFKLGQTVRTWKTIQRNGRDKHALVGLTATGVILLVERDGAYVVQAEVPMMTAPSCMTTYTRWNRTQQAIEGIVIVATQSDLVFLRVDEELETMRLYWMVSMNEHTVSAIEYFTVNDAHLVVLVSADADRPSANLYRFALDHRELYLRESITLTTPASTVAYLATGSEHFLTFPQRKSAIVFKYGRERFKFFVEITAESIETLEAFEMGGNAYLALGGARPRILRYHRGQFHDQTILAPSWGIVEHFLPIPARTYRDDLILLIQHRIDFATHNISVLEALIWNGEAFDPALSIPCIINGRKSDEGLGCMLDHDRELGIEGATVFQRNNFITILAPRHEAPSGLFDLEFELMPAEYEYDEAMIDLFAEILVMLESRDKQLADAHQTYTDFEMSRDEEIVVADRSFGTIGTHYAELTGEIAPTTKMMYGNEPTDAQTITGFILTVNEKQTIIAPEPPRAKRDDVESSNVVQWESLEVSNLFVESINNVSTAECVFVQNDTLYLNGTLVLQQSLDFDKVQWRTAGGPQETDRAAPELRQEAEGKEEENVAERLDVDGDFSFEEINGILWRDLINEIVLKNQPQELTELIVNGVSLPLAAIPSSNQSLKLNLNSRNLLPKANSTYAI